LGIRIRGQRSGLVVSLVQLGRMNGYDRAELLDIIEQLP
jgi:hypothetical protein